MSARDPRFEVVRSDAGHFARFIASNGKEVWRTSEVYTKRRHAFRAIELITGNKVHPYQDGYEVESAASGAWLLVEVRDVDERGDA